MESVEGADKSIPVLPIDIILKVIKLVQLPKDRCSVSFVCKEWYAAERATRERLILNNCNAVTPQIVSSTFPNLKSVGLTGQPRYFDSRNPLFYYAIQPREYWRTDLTTWVSSFESTYPGLEELHLKRMKVLDVNLEFIATRFKFFKSLSLVSCDGFSTDGLASIASNCRHLTKLEIRASFVTNLRNCWLSNFPETFTSLEVLDIADVDMHNNFQTLDRNFQALECIVTRCHLMKVLKLNKFASLYDLRKLLARTPRLEVLGTGSLYHMYGGTSENDVSFDNCRKLQSLSSVWGSSPMFVSALYRACPNVTILDLSNVEELSAPYFTKILDWLPKLSCVWVRDSIGDTGLVALASRCHLLEELRVFPADRFRGSVTELGLNAVSERCSKLVHLQYYCGRMTNDALFKLARNCPKLIRLGIHIIKSSVPQPDYLTLKPMDEGIGSIIRGCPKLRKLSITAMLTDLCMEYLGTNGQMLESLSLTYAGCSDWGLKCMLDGCSLLRKLEARNCTFGDAALLNFERCTALTSLWLSSCHVTLNACRLLAREYPRWSVVVENSTDSKYVQKVFVYRLASESQTLSQLRNDLF